MTSEPSRRAKLKEWFRRYLPSEISGTTVEFGGAALTYWATGSLAAAAVAGTIGASIGYYAAAYVTAVRCYHRDDDARAGVMRVVVAMLYALRSLAIEFGPAEVVDSALVRPAAFFLGPVLLGSTWLGWLAAKLFSDVIFYVFTICSYERFGALLAHRRDPEKVPDGSVDPVPVV
jgi:hypothetical protein